MLEERTGLTCSPPPDSFPIVLLLRHWPLFPKGIYHSFLLVVDSPGFQASPDSLVRCYGIHDRGVRRIGTDGYAAH